MRNIFTTQNNSEVTYKAISEPSHSCGTVLSDDSKFGVTYTVPSGGKSHGRATWQKNKNAFISNIWHAWGEWTSTSGHSRKPLMSPAGFLLLVSVWSRLVAKYVKCQNLTDTLRNVRLVTSEKACMAHTVCTVCSVPGDFRRGGGSKVFCFFSCQTVFWFLELWTFLSDVLSSA